MRQRVLCLAAVATGRPTGAAPGGLSLAGSAASDWVTKSGYQFRLAAGSDGRPASSDSCNGVDAAELTSSFVATASPESASAGTLDYWVGVSGTIYQWPQPITSTVGQLEPAGAQPVGSDTVRPNRGRGAGAAIRFQFRDRVRGALPDRPQPSA